MATNMAATLLEPSSASAMTSSAGLFGGPGGGRGLGVFGEGLAGAGRSFLVRSALGGRSGGAFFIIGGAFFGGVAGVEVYGMSISAGAVYVWLELAARAAALLALIS